MKRIQVFLGLLLCVSLAFGGCTKTGPVGPDGAQGAQGPAGPKGEVGPQGDSGEEGSAVIIASDWLSVSFGKQNDEWVGTIDDDAITQNLVDRAEIDIFLKTDGNVYTLNYFKVDDFYVTQDVAIGKITIHSSFDASPCRFRYVIVPAGAPADARMSAPDLKDYHAFCQYYGIAK